MPYSEYEEDIITHIIISVLSDCRLKTKDVCVSLFFSLSLSLSLVSSELAC